MYILTVYCLCVLTLTFTLTGGKGGHICHRFLSHSNNLLVFAFWLKLMLKAVDMQLVQTDVLAPVLRVGI